MTEKHIEANVDTMRKLYKVISDALQESRLRFSPAELIIVCFDLCQTHYNKVNPQVVVAELTGKELKEFLESVGA